VQRGRAKHEPRARLTDLGAVVERADVTRLGVLASQFEAMLHRLETHGIAVETLVDALLHLFRHGDFGGVRHIDSLRLMIWQSR
jgi:hypothetical protein